MLLGAVSWIKAGSVMVRGASELAIQSESYGLAIKFKLALLPAPSSASWRQYLLLVSEAGPGSQNL